MAWIPLESNPDVMSKYMHEVGVPEKYGITDVFGLDPELLALVPRPVYAVILLFPCSENYEAYKATEEEQLKDKDQNIPNDLYYMKQITHNACGTIALVHSIANSQDEVGLQQGILKEFLEKAAPLSPLERGELLNEMASMKNAHKDVAEEGQTEAPPVDEPIIHHFVAFVHKNGTLFELDGRKFGPISHGPTTPETLLEDAAKVCKIFMARDPEEVRFTIVALTATA